MSCCVVPRLLPACPSRGDGTKPFLDARWLRHAAMSFTHLYDMPASSDPLPKVALLCWGEVEVVEASIKRFCRKNSVRGAIRDALGLPVRTTLKFSRLTCPGRFEMSVGFPNVSLSMLFLIPSSRQKTTTSTKREGFTKTPPNQKRPFAKEDVLLWRKSCDGSDCEYYSVGNGYCLMRPLRRNSIVAELLCPLAGTAGLPTTRRCSDCS